MKLGNRIRTIRESKGISQSDLALGLKHLNQSQISKIETGNRKITVEDLAEILKALEISEKELIEEQSKLKGGIHNVQAKHLDKADG